MSVIKLVSKQEDAFVFDVEALREKLAIYADHKVAVISIAGAFRTGKSFLANWIIRYFELDRDENWLDSEDKLESQLEGFEFARQREPVTDGIDVWGTVFELEHAHHGNIAVVILDTQGIFSLGSDFSESVAIFAVSLFLSSIQIYNIRGNLTRSDLEHLRLFASYGQMMIDQNAEAACIPFQRLVFAIRDWELDDDLGLEAGTKFLQSVMEEMEDTEEGVELLNSLRTSFSKINCHLFRHPGSDAVRSDDFQGQVAQLDEEFKDGLKEFIPFVANDDTDNSSNVPTLKISPLKQVLTVDDFMDQIDAIKEIFDSGLIDKPESMYGAFSKVSHGKAVKEAAKYWNSKMNALLPDMPESRREKPIRTDFLNEAEFEEKLDKYSKKTWEIWNEQPKLADEEAMENVRKGLEEKMSQDIDNMRSENLNREALYDKTWAARCACIAASCACCIACKCS